MATQPVPSENALKLYPLNNDGSRPTMRSSFRDRSRRHHDIHCDYVLCLHYFHYDYVHCLHYFQHFQYFHYSHYYHFHRSRHIHNRRSRRSPSLPA